MTKCLKELTVEYYSNVRECNFEAVRERLHPEVEFFGPLSSLKGREEVVDATRRFREALSDLVIGEAFSRDDKAVLLYEPCFKGPVGRVSGVVIVTFKGEEISKLELFYDGKKLEEKREEIFSK